MRLLNKRLLSGPDLLQFPNWIKIALWLFLVWDAAYSFQQFYRGRLDGDIGNLSVPGVGYVPLFEDPLGIELIRNGGGRGGSNRYFSHLAIKEYFNRVPLWLQHFVSPIESVYLASALAKWFTHLSLIFLLWWYARSLNKAPPTSVENNSTLLLLAMATSLLQTHGNYSSMGLVDWAVTFSFFYSIPLCLLLFLFIPYWQWINGCYPEKQGWWAVVILLFSLPLCLSGPLISPCVLLLGGSFFLYRSIGWYNQKNFSIRLLDATLVFLLLSGLYSFYLGSLNSENIEINMGLGTMYERLAFGFLEILTRKPGFTILLLLCSLNYYLLKRYLPQKIHFRQIILFLGAFSLFYLLLLPFGGYRTYRPYFVRADTLMPATTALMIIWLSSSAILMEVLEKAALRNMLLLFFAVTIFLTFQDLYSPRDNDCERSALRVISESEAELVVLEEPCWVLGWAEINKPEHSVQNGIMLYRWRITKTPKRYYRPRTE